MSAVDNVVAQLTAAGLLVDITSLKIDTPDMVRCKVSGDKGRKESGFYRIFSATSSKGDLYYFGVYGNWKDPSIPEQGYSLTYDAVELSGAEKNALREKQNSARKQAAEERAEKQRNAAQRASVIWSNLNPQGNSPYLARKKVAALGIRFSRDAIAVPVRNEDSELVGLQFIQSDGSKKFLTGTAKSGAYHLIGDINSEDEPIAIAEGYATGASVHMATGWPVAIAFDAGNLVKVSAIARKRFPKRAIVIAADNDETGIAKAKFAAKETDAVVSLPTFSKPTRSSIDWNDLHCIESLDVVRKQLNGALSPATISSEIGQTETPIVPAGFGVNEDGVFYQNPDDDQRFWICGKLSVIAKTRNEDSKDWGLLVRFNDHDGREREWNIPMRLFAPEGGTRVVEGLYDLGLAIDPHRNSKRRLLDYLQRYKTPSRVLLVGNLGWHGSAFFLPKQEIVGTPRERLYYYSDRRPLNKTASKGALEDWKTGVARYCTNNPALMFAVCTAFGGPLLKRMHFETFGFNYVGSSSLGKSTIARVTASVCGGPDYVGTWNSTASALEPIAAEHSDSLLILDELSQSDPFTTGQTIYQLGNGVGKSRATDTGSGTRVQHRWRLVFLSNGERTLEEHVSNVGKKTQAGMDMRLLNLPACSHKDELTRKQKGVFEDLHRFANGAALSDHLKSQCSNFYGKALLSYLEYLTALDESGWARLIDWTKQRIEAFTQFHLSKEAGGQARRAAAKFALIGLAGELATKAGITGWQKGEALKAADTMYKLWIEQRGGEGNSEEQEVLNHIVLTLMSKGEIVFTRWDLDEPKTDSHAPRTSERWGYRKLISPENQSTDDPWTDEEFYIFKPSFERELCKGFDYKRARQLLKERGALVTSKDRPYTAQRTLPGTGNKRQDVYLIRMSALADLVSSRGQKEKLDAAA